MARRHELTDGRWEAIRDLPPGRAGDPGRTAVDNRLFVDAVLYVAKTGVPWADLPERYGKHDTARKRFDRWCAAGVWERPSEALGEPDPTELQLDSATVKAHPTAAAGRREAREKKAKPTPADARAAAAAD